MKTKKRIAFIFHCSISLALTLSACQQNKGPRGNALLLTGADISDHAQKGGVVEASPGVEPAPMSGGQLVVPLDKNLLQFRLADDVIPNSVTHGMLHYVLEYNCLGSFLDNRGQMHHYDDHCRIKEWPYATLELTVEKITACKDDPAKKEDDECKGANLLSFTPARGTRVVIKENRHDVA